MKQMVCTMAAGPINTLINSTEEVVRNSDLFKGFNEPTRYDFDDCCYLTYVGYGVENRFSLEGHLKTIYFYGFEEEDCGKFNGILPLALNFSMSREDVYSVLGEPQSTEADVKESSKDESGYWDLYHYDDYSLNIEYIKPNLGIKMVTVMSSDTAPYREKN